MKKALALIIISAILLTCLFGFSSCSGQKKITLVTTQGQTLGEYSGGEIQLEKTEYTAFFRYALSESLEIVKEKTGFADSPALDYLTQNNAVITTTANPEKISAVAGTVTSFFSNDTSATVAITGENARLEVIYSSSGQVEKTFAGSSVKPLSVYAPCIEKGIMTWSSVMEDSAVKTLDDGSLWPTNGRGYYTNANVTAADGLKLSLNTIAVKWLKEYGVRASMDFLRDNFGFDLEEEYNMLALSSEDEILGNIALGYLRAGVDECEMAGAYRIFSTGGVYTEPYCVEKITDGKGAEIFAHTVSENRVISEETAFIMDRMLRRVLEKGGTAEKAACDNVNVVGKSGTSDNNEDNWFVGVTPVNSVAIYHTAGSGAKQNRSAELFPLIVKSAGLESDEEFPSCDSVKTAIICTESGLLLGDDCTLSTTGLFTEGTLPGRCDIHN